MKFTSFRIRNYKGIVDTTITLNGNKGSIYTLVGLNESGKTTVLEAINNFRHDVDGVHIIAQKSVSTEPIESVVPKRLKDNFNGNTSITVTVRMEPEDLQSLAHKCNTQHGFQLDIESFPLTFTVARRHTFQNSEHAKSQTYWNLDPKVKKKRARVYRTVASSTTEWQTIVREIGRLFPRIVYFPTFLFDFPEKILVSDGDADFEGNEYFKRMIEDALSSLDDPLNLKTHVVDRVLNKEPSSPFNVWFGIWMQSDQREQVNTALGKLSQKISREVFGRWKEVLGSDIGQKELVVDHLIEEGDDDTRKVFLTFSVKDGYSTFKVSERSLGFRWFFCFLLFTRFFRGSATGGSMFLFDEPASNLHSKAQSKLLDCLSVIASEKNDIVYSTHSHHLINPLWLETAFITTNGEPHEDVTVDTDFVVDNTNIKAEPYKTFVGQNAEKSHYFQPILDRLQVSPSLLEARHEGVFTEGKSDFYILNWYKKYHDPDCGLDFIPVGGAANGGALISLYLGLAVRFVFLLDSDKGGDDSKERYLRDLPVSSDAILQIADAFPRRRGVNEIEDLISPKTKKFISDKYGVSRTSKKHILRAYSEALSGHNDIPRDPDTLGKLKILMDFIASSFETD